MFVPVMNKEIDNTLIESETDVVTVNLSEVWEKLQQAPAPEPRNLKKSALRKLHKKWAEEAKALEAITPKELLAYEHNQITGGVELTSGFSQECASIEEIISKLDLISLQGLTEAQFVILLKKNFPTTVVKAYQEGKMMEDYLQRILQYFAKMLEHNFITIPEVKVNP